MKLVVEAGPLGTSPLFETFEHFEDYVGKLIVETGPLGTAPLLR